MWTEARSRETKDERNREGEKARRVINGRIGEGKESRVEGMGKREGKDSKDQKD